MRLKITFFWDMIIPPQVFTLKMEITYYSETLLAFNHTTHEHTSKDNNLRGRRNPKNRIGKFVYADKTNITRANMHTQRHAHLVVPLNFLRILKLSNSVQIGYEASTMSLSQYSYFSALQTTRKLG
jgi:hypothetical protein